MTSNFARTVFLGGIEILYKTGFILFSLISLIRESHIKSYVIKLNEMKPN